MIINSHFKPAAGLSNAHIQTLLPTLLRARTPCITYKQTLELIDGDFVDLAWTSPPVANKPIVIIFHGLEGSVDSPYAKGIMIAVEKYGWTGLLMHFRGCSQRQNRLARSYHSGDTADAKYLISWLNEQYPSSPLAAVGFSLGGNMLLKLLAELSSHSQINAAVSVCSPLLLNDCATRLDSGFSKIYQRHLLNRMKRNLLLKTLNHDYKQLIALDYHSIHQLKNFRQFDNVVTAPLHGFNGVDDYYKQSSARQYLKDIQTHTLLLQSLDDPFMTNAVLPEESELSNYLQLELSRFGGHVGFVSGSLLKPEFWLEKRITQYLDTYL